jgi:hypothetical protein
MAQEFKKVVDHQWYDIPVYYHIIMSKMNIRNDPIDTSHNSIHTIYLYIVFYNNYL